MLLAAPAATQPAGQLPSCPALRWVTLGTAGGPVPTAERSEPANLLVAGGDRILVDAGDGAANQLARIGVDLGQVRAIFISHHHMDHTGGLAAVIGLRWMNQFPGVLTVYGPPGTRELVDAIVASMAPQGRIGFGLGKAPPAPAASVQVVEMRDGSVARRAGLTVTAAANSHFAHPGPASADEPQSLSYRFDLGTRAIAYTGDTGPSPAVARLATGSDLLVSEVIDLDNLVAEIVRRRRDASPEMLADMRSHLSTHHLTAEDVGRIAAAAKVGRVVLTHFAAPPGPLPERALSAGVRTRFAGPVRLAHDLQAFEVECR
jgi:ribonuclease BN (tRNA processing enzyme)